jgi:hypothetical protein
MRGCRGRAGDDWIQACSEQAQVRDLVDLLIANLGG